MTPIETRLVNALEELLHNVSHGNSAWKRAVIEKLVVSHIYTDEHETNPEKALNDLLDSENALCLDPRVSPQAQALIDRGRASVTVTPGIVRRAINRCPAELAGTHEYTWIANDINHQIFSPTQQEREEP
jgi:hypothetical protein